MSRSASIRGSEGFGLVELLIAMTILTVAIGALVAVFGASIVSLRHSASEGTAITLADRQLETYRSMPFACIPDTTFAEPAGCGTYSGFPNPYPTTGCSPPTTGCARQVTTSTESPDHRIYKVTTVVSSAPGSVRQINVTVGLNSGGPVLARETSYFSSDGTST